MSRIRQSNWPPVSRKGNPERRRGNALGNARASMNAISPASEASRAGRSQASDDGGPDADDAACT